MTDPAGVVADDVVTGSTWWARVSRSVDGREAPQPLYLGASEAEAAQRLAEYRTFNVGCLFRAYRVDVIERRTDVDL